jgi:ribosomal protein S18 acetylase RimI-like enzyme
MSLTMRPGQLSDVESVLRLWSTAGAEPSHTDDTASLAALIRHDPSALIVAEDGASIVGSVIAGWDGWRGSIYRLVVAHSHRRLGLGTRLLHRAEERLSAEGAVRLQAIVVATEAQAVGFWRSGGWEQQAYRLRFVKG